MLREICYNKFEVIDIICYNKLFTIISHPKIDIVINNIWRGPYKQEFFLNASTIYYIILNELKQNSKFL